VDIHGLELSLLLKAFMDIAFTFDDPRLSCMIPCIEIGCFAVAGMLIVGTKTEPKLFLEIPSALPRQFHRPARAWVTTDSY
jgi:hypothetical protein